MHGEAGATWNEAGPLMPPATDCHAALEARSHAAQRGARLTLNGGSEHRDAETQQGGRERCAFRNLVSITIDGDLDERGH